MLGLRQRTVACPQCGHETDRRARWCGSCGAIRRAPTDHEEHQATPDHAGDPGSPPPDRPARSRLRTTTGVAVSVTVLAVSAAVLRPAPVATSLLGRLDTGTGSSATHPPASGLAVAWRQSVGTPDDERWYLGSGGASMVVRDGRVTFGGVVVDGASGDLVADLRGAPLHGTWGVTGEAAMLRGAALHVIDVPTGAVVARADVDAAELPGEGGHVDVAAAARGDSTSLFGVWGPPDEHDPHGFGRWVLVGDDGSLVAGGPGSPYGWGPEQARSTTHAVIVVPPEVVDPEGPWGPEQWGVLDLRTGEEVLRVRPDGDADWTTPPQVLGHHALVVRPVTQDGIGAVSTWDVELHDLVALERVWRVEMTSDEPPVLHAVTGGDGAGVGGVVATRAQSEIAVAHVDAEGRTEVARTPSGRQDLLYNGSATAVLVAADADVVVTLDPDAEVLVATHLDGTPAWRSPLPPIPTEAVVELDAAGGMVAVLVDDGHLARLHVVRRDDGSAATRAAIGRMAHPGMGQPAPAAVVDGLVAVASDGEAYWAAPAATLGAVDWFDVRDGRERALDEVAKGWLRPDDAPPELLDDEDGSIDTSDFLRARFSGTVVGDDGRVRPVVVWPERALVVRMLVGEGPPQDITLEPELRTASPDQPVEVVAVVGRDLVLRRIDGDGRASTFIVDRELGRVQELLSVWPYGVAGDTVIGRHDADGRVSLVGHDLVDGRRLWEVPWSWGDTIAVGTRAVAVLTGTEVVVLEAGSGEVVWRTGLEAPGAGAPVLTDRSVLVRTAYGDVLALDRVDGTVGWRRHLGTVVTALGAAGEHALVGTHDGAVVELDDRGREVQRVVVGSSPVSAVASVGPGLVAIAGEQVIGLQPEGTGIARQDEVPLP